MPTTAGHTSAIRAKKVIGTSVKDMSGEKIGTVEDLVLDKSNNTILFAVVGFGGVLKITSLPEQGTRVRASVPDKATV